MARDNSGSVTVRLGKLRAPFADYCNTKGICLSDGIRLLIGESLIQNPNQIASYAFDDEANPRIRLNLRLTLQEYEAIKERVGAERFSSANRWIVSLIRANLQREPEFGESGLDALHESNRLLAPLARNLNQLTRDLRQNTIQIPAYRFQIMENLQKAVSAHIKVIARVISRNVGRWRTE